LSLEQASATKWDALLSKRNLNDLVVTSPGACDNLKITFKEKFNALGNRGIRHHMC